MASNTTVSLSNLNNNESEPVSDIKAFVTGVLKLPPTLNKMWDIIDLYPNDSQPQLALAHYNKETYDPYNRTHEPLRKVRGTIVDLNTGAVVCDAYGHTQSLPCLEALDADENVIKVHTEVAKYINNVEDAPDEVAKFSFGVRQFDKTTTKLFLGYEGAMIRLFKWNGQVFFSTHCRIDASRSNWGGRTQFFELFKQLGGPDISSLFGEEPFSPYCHLFLIVHNEIRLATSTSDNRIIYLGVKKVWDENVFAGQSGPYAWQGEFTLKTPTFGQEPPVFSNNHNRALIVQPAIDTDIANKFLFPNDYAKDIPQSSGYQAKEHEILVDYADSGRKVNEIYFQRLTQKIADEKLSGGDFVILYTQTPEGQTIVYRLEPTAFEYRTQITANDPNLYHRFAVQMVDFTKADPQVLRDAYPKYIDANGTEIRLDNAQDRQVYWWSLFYDAVAPYYKDKVDGFYSLYQSDIKSVADFIMNDYPKIVSKATNDPVAQEKLKRINDNTKKRFEDLRTITMTAANRNRQSPMNVLRNLLSNETGPSLYKMISTVKNIKKFELQPKTVQATA